MGTVPTPAARERLQQCVLATIAALGADAGDVTTEASLNDLDMDVLDMLELSQIVHAEFGVRIRATDVSELVTVGDTIDLLLDRLG